MIARKAPDQELQLVDPERAVEYAFYSLPFVQELLYRLAAIREVVFIIDGSEV